MLTHDRRPTASSKVLQCTRPAPRNPCILPLASHLRVPSRKSRRFLACSASGGMMAFRWRWLALLALVVCVFFWKIAFTRQYSILTGYEGANQSYAWDNYVAVALHNGSLPLWDPFTHSGHSFPREMQTALFYPPKLILYYWPLNREGLFSPALFHYFFVFAHIAAAWFMFLLAREIGLRTFPAFLAAITFA